MNPAAFFSVYLLGATLECSHQMKECLWWENFQGNFDEKFSLGMEECDIQT